MNMSSRSATCNRTRQDRPTVTGPSNHARGAHRWSPNPRSSSVAVVVMLFGSGVLVALAPAMMPHGYSWTEHGISESAAQGIDGAWSARMGFVVFGLAVVWLSSLQAGAWETAGTMLHMCFGVCMLGVAAFSTRPWSDDATYVKSEDVLHSVFASTMGFAFIVGTASVLVAKRMQTHRVARLDLGAVVTTTALSAAMGAFPEIYGVLQRLMFLVAYCWYANEAHQHHRHDHLVTISARVGRTVTNGNPVDDRARSPGRSGRVG